MLRVHKAGADNGENESMETQLVGGDLMTIKRERRRKGKSDVLDDGDEEEEDEDEVMPVVKTKTRQVKMLHSGFGKAKKPKKTRKTSNNNNQGKKGSSAGQQKLGVLSTDTDLSEIQKDLEIIRSGLQKQKEEQERLERERASQSSHDPGREKITGSTDPMPIQGTNADGLQPDGLGVGGSMGGDDGVGPNEDTTAMVLLNMGQVDHHGHAMDTSE